MSKCSSRYFWSAFFGLILISFAYSCEKNTSDSVPAQEERSELPALELGTDGLVSFDDVDAFVKTYTSIKGATTDELMRWQSQTGFLSVNYHFEQVWGEMCSETYQEDTAILPGDHPNVNVSEDGGVYPLINAGFMGWLINEKGQFKVGKSLITITDDAVISVLDGDADKAALAVRTLREDIADGVYVRLQNPVSNARSCCPSNTINTGTVTDDKKRIKEAYMRLADRSFVASFPTGIDQYGNFIYATGYQIIYEMDYFFHHQRKTLFGWTVCERTYWSFDSSWRLVHNFSPILGAPASPIIGSINNFTTGFECKYNRTDGIVFIPFVTPAQYATQGVTCIDLLDLEVITGNGIAGDASCGQ